LIVRSSLPERQEFVRELLLAQKPAIMAELALQQQDKVAEWCSETWRFVHVRLPGATDGIVYVWCCGRRVDRPGEWVSWFMRRERATSA
jgi:ADP-dependent phosphofructokinase/glucokinase